MILSAWSTDGRQGSVYKTTIIFAVNFGDTSGTEITHFSFKYTSAIGQINTAALFPHLTDLLLSCDTFHCRPCPRG